MPKKHPVETPLEFDSMTHPMVAATLTGIIYNARLRNRESKLNIPDSEVFSDIINLWRAVKGELAKNS